SIQESVAILHQSIIPLQVKQQLSNYANSLSDGDPCPLCGSVHHPDIAKTDVVSHEIKDLEVKINHLKAEESKLQRLETEIHNLHFKNLGVGDRIVHQQSLSMKMEEKIAEHRLLKPEMRKDASLAVVKDQLKEKLSQRELLSQKKVTREKLRLAVQKLETACEEKRNFVHEISKKQATESAKVDQMKQMLKTYEYNKFEKHTSEELSSSLERGLKF